MLYRRLDGNGDYILGQGAQQFLSDSPETVAQAIKTRLGLFQGEWFLDTSFGVPWLTEVVGFSTVPLYDTAIKGAIFGVEGVSEIVDYSSQLNSRTLTVRVTVTTPFGAAKVVATLDTASGFGIGGYGLRGYGQ